MRIVLRASVVAAALPLAACFQSSTVVHVKADGSGTIEQRTLVTDAALDQLRAFTILGGGRGGDVDPLSESQARDLASAIGTGVTYVSSMPTKIQGSQGRDATYAFTDISQVRLSEQPQIPGANISVRGTGIGDSPIAFTMSRQADGSAVLRILVPGLNLPGTAGSPNGISAPTPDQLEMAKQLLAGAHLTVAVEPEGRLVRTSSPYVEGNRVTLIDVDLDQATKDPALLEKLRSMKTLEDAKAAVKDVPGLKLNLDPEITIEFTPAK